MAAKTPADRERELAYEVGQVILAWSEAEWRLIWLLSAALNCDVNRGRIVWASSTSFRAKRDLLTRLGETYFVDTLLPEFRDIMAKVKHLSEKRNALAHDRSYHLQGATFTFMNDQDPTQPETFGRSRTIQVGTVRVWAKEIRQLDQQIMRFTARLLPPDRALLAQPRLLSHADPDAGRSPVTP